MPELPEIEIVKRSLVKSVKNAKIIGIKIKNRRLRYQIPNTFSKDLLNEKIIDISRRSKYLIFKLEKKILLVHLGMSGKFLLKTKRDKELFKTSFYYNLNIPKKHNHIYFILNNNLILIYNDVRRFGFLKIFKTKNLSKVIFLTKLGVEPLSKKFSKKYFSTFVKKRKKNIKNLLMDQTFISGLGNIYVNEALFMSKIHPSKKSNKLNKSEIENLVINIKKILKFSISKGGASIKNFKDTMDKSGKFQQFFYVYNKENKNCSRISCKGKIKRIIISSRSSFYCNKCQK
tara:strand:- start:24 stop:887 length:864 start_codon:yes stop_codon:yes gene_type:complete